MRCEKIRYGGEAWATHTVEPDRDLICVGSSVPSLAHASTRTPKPQALSPSPSPFSLGQVYAFPHEVERVAIAGLMLETQRQDVLRRLISFLENKTARPDGRRYLPILTKHCIDAGESGKACLLQADAAVYAARDGMNSEVIMLLKSCVALAPKTTLADVQVGRKGGRERGHRNRNDPGTPEPRNPGTPKTFSP